MAEGDVPTLDCSICLSAFKVPKLLPCFHTFCFQCLDEYVIRNGQDGKFECPLCRTSTDIPEGGVQSFQSNFYIWTGNTSEVDVVCDICGDGHDATHYCTDCEENFCERCTTSHMKMKISREHGLLQLNDSSDNGRRCVRKVRKKYYCQHHKEDEVKMVCKDCDAMLCVVCKLTEHENHNTSSVTKEAEERRASLSTSIAGAERDLDVLKSRKRKANNLEIDAEKNLKQSIATLDARVESMMADIKKGADTIKQELVKSITEAKDYYVQKEKELQRKITEKQAVINHAQNVVDTGDDVQVLETELMPKLQVLTPADECKVTRHKGSLTFKVSETKITDDSVGKISVLCYDVDVKELYQLGRDIIPGPTEVNALSLNTERLYAAFTDYGQFFYHETQTSQSYYTDVLYGNGTCAGLACIGDDTFFTSTEDKALYKLKMEDHVKSKFESFEHYPHGIASRPCGSHDRCKEILICILKSEKLFDTNGSEGSVIAICLRNKEQNIWRKQEIPGPACIATSAVNGNVCLGYPAAHKVTVNTSTGFVLTEYSGEESPGDSKIFCPVSVCYDRLGFIIVADYHNETVIRIDDIGNFLQCLIQKKTPLSVVINENNILYVGFTDDNITSYQLNPKE